MDKKIKIGICGYGNLGKGVETGIDLYPDMELAAVFTRRTPAPPLKIKKETPVVHINSVALWKDKIDVMILCGGSSNDLPTQGPELARLFNTVDSFDTHAKIPEYFDAVDKSAKIGENTAIISLGWDPGLFSLMRLYMGAIIPDGMTYTFWGKGVSQGHSEAVRRIEGVVDAVQYTIPVEAAMKRVRNGDKAKMSAREKHTRLCYVVAAENADKTKIASEIKGMPYYFDEYDTTVSFISSKEMKAKHSALPHGGSVIHTGTTGAGSNQTLEFSLKLDSNPEFTSSVLLAYARVAYMLSEKGEHGAKTIFDIPPALLLGKNGFDAIKTLL